jgi:hypothetical protein
MKALPSSLKGFFHQDRLESNFFKRIPVFIQYICTYFFIVIIMFFILLSISSRMKDVAIDSFLNQTRLNLESSAASFERQIDNFKSMHFSMNQIEFYREMRILKELQLRNHYGLLKLQELFRQQCLLLEIPNSSFCLFKRNGSIVTNSRYYTDNMDYFGKKIHVEGLDMEKVLKILYSNRSFLSVYMVSMDEKVPEPYLAYMFQPMNESAIYGMLMSESDILTFFRLNEICPNARLTILNKSGDTLYTNWNGLNDDNFTNIEYGILLIDEASNQQPAFHQHLYRILAPKDE